MRRLRIIQIGDIHFPDAHPLVDATDPGMPSSVITAVAPNPLQNMMRSVLSVCQDNTDLAGIFLCGDLTSRGDLAGYRDCVAYLRQAIHTACPQFWNSNSIHVVPGNHDVDRSLADPAGTDLFQKFSPLRDVWNDPGGPILSISSLRCTTVNIDTAYASLFSLNSCLGCGERRYLPAELSQFPTILRRLNPGMHSDRLFELLGEQLDTPAFAETHMSELVQAIRDLPAEMATVATAHHNILPQALPRIAVYTEVLNSGLVRSRLAQCGRRVIYCHGHIHEGPVELVTTPADADGGLIIVSVPQFADGFNMLELQYGLRGRPLGLIIHPYRIRPDGTVAIPNGDVMRVPLVSARDVDVCAPDRLMTVLHALEYGSFVKWNAALEAVRGVLNVQIRAQRLADILLDAEWLGGVELMNRDRNLAEWHIRRVLA